MCLFCFIYKVRVLCQISKQTSGNVKVNNSSKMETVDQKSPENEPNEETQEEEIWRIQKLEREEYLKKLKKWLDEARLWHYSVNAGLPFNTAENGARENVNQDINNIFANLTRTNLMNFNSENVLLRRFVNNLTNRNLANVISPTTQATHTPGTYEFVIPPLWKRALAELMDFFLLFLFKMALTFVLMESFDIIDMGFYGFDAFQKSLENSEVAMPMAMELLTLELLHRIVVCAYETYFLQGKFCATPGKRYMGLMVITAETITPVHGRLSETISATGATPLGWQKSLTRAALKNLFLGLFLPMCLAFYILPHNRTSYDMMSNSIVVEYHQEFMLYNPAL